MMAADVLAWVIAIATVEAMAIACAVIGNEESGTHAYDYTLSDDR